MLKNCAIASSNYLYLLRFFSSFFFLLPRICFLVQALFGLDLGLLDFFLFLLLFFVFIYFFKYIYWKDWLIDIACLPSRHNFHSKEPFFSFFFSV